MGKKSRRHRKSNKSNDASTNAHNSAQLPVATANNNALRELLGLRDAVVFDASAALAQGFDGPRYTLEGTHALSNIDYHAWCVDESNNICDYPDSQIYHGPYGTTNIIRRPWDADLVAKFLPYLETLFDAFQQMHPKTKEQHLRDIENNTFPQNNCYARAKILRDSNEKKYALVVGSLGYVQDDGRIFWEYG